MLSAASANSLHAFCLAALTSFWQIRFASFHFFLSTTLLFLLYLLRRRFCSFRRWVSSSVHQLLLNGDGCFLGVVCSIAFWAAAIVLAVNWSSLLGELSSGPAGSLLGWCGACLTFHPSWLWRSCTGPSHPLVAVLLSLAVF